MKNTSEERSAAILNSIDGIQPAEVPPYFYTRLVARMQNELVAEKQPFFLLRPAFLTTSLSLVLLINIFCLFRFKAQKDESMQVNGTSGIQSFADAYNLNATAVYE